MKTKNYSCPLCQKQISVTVYDSLNREKVAREKFEIAVKEHLQTHKRLTPVAADAAVCPACKNSIIDGICLSCNYHF